MDTLGRSIHWLALDSVAVLLAYQWWLLREGSVQLPEGVSALLGLGVWTGYCADRLLDVTREPERAGRSRRHAFHARHLVTLAATWMCVVGALTVIGFRMLPASALYSGLAVAAGAAAYVWVFGRPAKSPQLWRWPKRVGTAGLLAVAGMWWAFWFPPGRWPVLLLGGLHFFAAAWWSLALLEHRVVKPVPAWNGQKVACTAVLVVTAGLLGETGAWLAAACVALGLSAVEKWAYCLGDPDYTGLLLDGVLVGAYLLGGLLR